MMHDSVTTSPSPATGFSKTNLSARELMTTSNGSRRPQSVGMQKPERPVLTSSANTNGGGRWRVNSSGQLVDLVSAEWDIADEIVKLQISDNGAEPKSHTLTPPQNRGHMGIVGVESSPLETSSETSIGSSNSSSPFEQAVNLLTHSRGSSADTTVSSHASGYSASSQTLHPYTPLKASGIGESRNRPHSYSGGLSKDDLVRLSQVGGSSPAQDAWYSPNGTPERISQPEQPSYPTITGQGYLSRHEQPPMMSTSRIDGLQVDYQTVQQRQFSPLQQASMMQAGGVLPSTFPHGRSNTISHGTQYRQRNYNPPVPTILQSPPNFAYPAPLHPAAISLNGGQQVYDMMLPTPPLENPTMARLQQQSTYRGGHQHSASDPASLRDPATLALLNNNMQAAFAAGQMYGPGIIPPNVALFSQFYGTPDAYSTPEVNLMNLQPQYTGQFGLGPGRNAPPNSAPLTGQLTGSGHGGSNSNNSANRKLGLYKTELCRSWEEKGSCRYGSKCQFAHGEEELRLVQRHPKYKTEICRTFWVSGTCPYGKRCCFIHTEVPGAGQPGQDGMPPLSATEGRPRSDSDTTPGEHSSLLNRIRTQEASSNNKSTSNTPPSAGRPGPGSLRVDTSVLDPAAAKQNKSAFPSFTHNGILMQANEEAPSMSPGPVTAAPDFGRHASARMDIVGTQRRKSANLDPNLRHSFNGSEVQLDFSATTPTAANQSSQFNVNSDVPTRSSRINGHVRSGSAGNWGSATRNSHLAAYPLSSIPGGELKTNMPWAESVSRVTESNWV